MPMSEFSPESHKQSFCAYYTRTGDLTSVVRQYFCQHCGCSAWLRDWTHYTVSVQSVDLLSTLTDDVAMCRLLHWSLVTTELLTSYVSTTENTQHTRHDISAARWLLCTSSVYQHVRKYTAVRSRACNIDTQRHHGNGARLRHSDNGT